MHFISGVFSNRKTILPFCNTSPPQMIFYTPTCCTSLKRGSQHADTRLLREDSTIKNLVPEGNNGTSTWINASSGLDGRYKNKTSGDASIAIISIPKPTLKLHSSSALKKTQTILYLLLSSLSSTSVWARKAPGREIKQQGRMGKTSAPKRWFLHRELNATDILGQINIIRGATDRNKCDCLLLAQALDAFRLQFH